DMIGDLMLFARPPAPEPVWTDLATIAREVVAPFADRAAETGVTLSVDAPGPVASYADPTHVAVALSALVENALNAVRRGGRVTVTVVEPEGVPTVTVLDDGRGFSDADREHAFDPFYSGRQAGRGLGFGLPKAWRIVTLAGGTIAIDSRPGKTAVRITLPRPTHDMRE
ncbi:MAG TPA: HAMP domain-containing sensor histidine kinase, partial [Planctomycetaceae bacterium]